ncbi:MAG: hypothetical protein HZB16_02385 [Armatimonadetes bacterium]|nr:hypothetical protein [Armatimonadota bacterium]
MSLDDLSRRDFVGLVALSATALTAGRAVAAPGHAELIPPEKALPADWLASLTTRGRRTVLSGTELELVGMPCGGLTTGQMYLGGDGRLWHWDVMNLTAGTGDGHYANPPKPSSPLDQGFALAVTSGGQTDMRGLDRDGFAEVRFTGEYPLATIEYSDPACPVKVKLEAGSPFIPGDLASSSFPATLLAYTLTNTSNAPVDVELAGWLENAVGLRTGADWSLTRTNRIQRAGGLLWLDCAGSVPAEGSGGRAAVTFADFEGETYGEWKAEGAAVGTAPSRKAGHDQRLAGFEGKGLVNTYPDSDQPQGSLTSPTFTISRRCINFLIGGGDHPGETCINLLIDGKVVRTATGKNTDAMAWASWNVAEFEGKTATIQIVDRHSGGWGHIDIDQIEFADRPRRARTDATQEPDWGTMGLALLDAKPTDRGVSALPAGAIPSGLFAVAGAGEGPQSRPFGRRLRGALSRRLTLAPGASAEVVFAVCWHFGNLYLDDQRRGRQYAARFADARAVATELARSHAELRRQTRLWCDTWYDSTLPYWLLDRTLANASILATSTTQRWDNGRIWGWEGVGCCVGTCTHVWHYAQAAARLFPEVERIMREQQDFGPGLGADGQIGMRGEWNGRAAIDGHCGTILRAYREHQMSADDAFLERLWPRVKRALDWAIGEDGNNDGYIEKGEHNTLDTDWFGPHAWFNTLYLAALRAGAAMAREMGEPDAATRYDTLVASGVKLLEERLYNGEYFVHLKDPTKPEALGSGQGCEIDQVFGQHWTRMVGLGGFIDPAKVRSALASLYKYNFAVDVGPYRKVHTTGRMYAMPGEGGLLMCTFPKGGEDEALGKPPVWASMYFNECMNGFEYQAAGHMIWEGLVTEGLAVTRALHDRYGAAKRNPYNEVECGDHYARSMASYGVFLAVCGYEYHGPKGHLGFAPRVSPEQFQAAFTAAEGWGTYRQTRAAGTLAASVSVKWGQVRLRTMSFEAQGTPKAAKVTLANQAVPATVSQEGTRLLLTLGRDVTVPAGGELKIELA